jgi:hypothetical protein
VTNLNEILELVCLGLLEVACGVRLHHVAHVLVCRVQGSGLRAQG